MRRDRIPHFLAGAAAVATVVSIAAFEILMALALAAMLLTPEARRAWRWPPVMLPLSAWIALTVISAFASGDISAAMPQLKKFYIYLMLFLVFAAFREVCEIRWVAAGWALGAALSALWSAVQITQQFTGYTAYVSAARATGFMGHWMTFGGEMMMALLFVGSAVLFSAWRRARPWLAAACVVIAFGLLASYTRSMWLGALVGGTYLMWVWRRWSVLAIPVFVGILMLADPFAVRERALSAFRPTQFDSNEFRVVTREIGWEMVKAHPLFGIGPEQVSRQYQRYIPASTPRPLPTGFYGHLHNIYIHYAAERGIPALLALLWLIGRAIWDFARAVGRSSGEVRWVLQGALAVTAAVLLSGWYELNLGDSEVLGMFLAVMGLGYSAVHTPTPAADKP